MTESDSTDHALDRACRNAQALSNALVEKGRTNPEQRHIATAMALGVRSIVALIGVDDTNRAHLCAERIEDLARESIQVMAEAIHLSDDGYDLSDVNAQLGVAQTIVEMLNSVVTSPIFSGNTLEWLGDLMHDQLTPFLRLAVRLQDPDKFADGFVPDAWVQAGAKASAIAAHLSHVIACAGIMASDARAASGLAA